MKFAEAKPKGATPGPFVSAKESYVPARDKPQHTVRPGGDDHKQYKSLEDKGQTVYHDRGHE